MLASPLPPSTTNPSVINLAFCEFDTAWFVEKKYPAKQPSRVL